MQLQFSPGSGPPPVVMVIKLPIKDEYKLQMKFILLLQGFFQTGGGTLSMVLLDELWEYLCTIAGQFHCIILTTVTKVGAACSV